jgi:hypothetical protein
MAVASRQNASSPASYAAARRSIVAVAASLSTARSASTWRMSGCSISGGRTRPGAGVVRGLGEPGAHLADDPITQSSRVWLTIG